MDEMKINATVLLVACVILGSGCASTSTIQHRGWMGGSLSEAYKPSFVRHVYSGARNIPALPTEVASQQKKAVFVSRVFPNTPVSQADLREGDLILAVNDRTRPSKRLLIPSEESTSPEGRH